MLRLLYRFDFTLNYVKSVAFWSPDTHLQKKTPTLWRRLVLCSCPSSSASLFSPPCLSRRTLSSPTTSKFLTSLLRLLAYLNRFAFVLSYLFFGFSVLIKVLAFDWEIQWRLRMLLVSQSSETRIRTSGSIYTLCTNKLSRVCLLGFGEWWISSISM